jgi:hypothetical protein
MGADSDCSGDSLDDGPDDSLALDDAETLSFLHACVSTKRHRVRVPETPIYLDALLARISHAM